MHRIPAFDLQSEQTLLGLLMVDNRRYREIRYWLTWIHFADPIHAEIFTAILRKIRQGELADAITLKYHFEPGDTLAKVGGTTYLAALLSAVTEGNMDITVHARRILATWILRQDELVDELKIWGWPGEDGGYDPEAIPRTEQVPPPSPPVAPRS